MDFTVEQLKLMALALIEREVQNKDRFRNPAFDRETLVYEIELSELTRFKIYDLITDINFKKKMEERKNEYIN